MGELVYSLCVITSLICAWKLIAHYRRTGSGLLLWSSLCFGLLALANILLFVDFVLIPTAVDLSMLRHMVTLSAAVTMLFGLIWESV